MVRSALNVPATSLPSPLRRLTELTVPPTARTVTGVVTGWSSLPLRGVTVSRASAAGGVVVGAADGFPAPPVPAACGVVDPPPLEQPATSATSAPATAATRTTAVPRQKPRISLPPQRPARSRSPWISTRVADPIVARSPRILGDDPDTSDSRVPVHPNSANPRVTR